MPRAGKVKQAEERRAAPPQERMRAALAAESLLPSAAASARMHGPPSSPTFEIADVQRPATAQTARRMFDLRARIPWLEHAPAPILRLFQRPLSNHADF